MANPSRMLRLNVIVRLVNFTIRARNNGILNCAHILRLFTVFLGLGENLSAGRSLETPALHLRAYNRALASAEQRGSQGFNPPYSLVLKR